MHYALLVVPLLLAAPAFAQAPQQQDRPLVWSGKDRLMRPAYGVDGLYREPYTGSGALNRGPYAGGGQIYELTPQPDQGASAGTDWSRPVTGVDSLLLAPARSTENVTLPLVVITQGKTAESAAEDAPLPPPCEPPVAKAQPVKPPPAPCPAPPR